MATNAKAGWNTLLKKGSTTIVDVTEIGDVGPDRDMLDGTSMDSTSAVKEKIAGLLDNGQVSFTVNWNPSAATHLALLTDAEAGTWATYNIVWPDAANWAFSACPKSVKVTADHAGKLVGRCVLEITGAITRT